MVATLIFMAAAIATVAIVRHVIGGRSCRSFSQGFLCGLVFGVGLLISGMTQTEKVIGFLDVFGTWDATLAFVMAGAVAVASIGFALAKQHGTPILAAQSL